VSGVDELVAFVRRCLDEDERVARAAIADDCGQDGGFEDADWLTDRDLPTTTFGDAAAAMIRRFAVPRRVLAEVEAKRQLLDLHSSGRSYREDGLSVCGACRKNRVYPCCVVRLIAKPHAGQDGWREEWLA
jgi:hypothetical protein